MIAPTRIAMLYPSVMFVKSLPLMREATAWRTMATASMTITTRNPFQVSADSMTNTPATRPNRITPFLDPASASAALTILTRKYTAKATRKAARAYSFPLENTEVLIGRAMNASTSAATTPIVLSNSSLPIRYTGMQSRAPKMGFSTPSANDAASVVPMEPWKMDATPAARKSMSGGM